MHFVILLLATYILYNRYIATYVGTLHVAIIYEVFDEFMTWIAVICQILQLSLSIDNRIDHFIDKISI